jgi:hypothetical protein
MTAKGGGWAAHCGQQEPEASRTSPQQLVKAQRGPPSIRIQRVLPTTLVAQRDVVRAVAHALGAPHAANVQRVVVVHSQLGVQRAGALCQGGGEGSGVSA